MREWGELQQRQLKPCRRPTLPRCRKSIRPAATATPLETADLMKGSRHTNPFPVTALAKLRSYSGAPWTGLAAVARADPSRCPLRLFSAGIVESTGVDWSQLSQLESTRVKWSHGMTPSGQLMRAAKHRFADTELGAPGQPCVPGPPQPCEVRGKEGRDAEFRGGPGDVRPRRASQTLADLVPCVLSTSLGERGLERKFLQPCDQNSPSAAGQDPVCLLTEYTIHICSVTCPPSALGDSRRASGPCQCCHFR